MDNKSKKDLVLYDSITGILAAVALEAIYPPFGVAALCIKVAGVIGISFFAMTYSKYDLVFKNCGLNKGQAVPLLKTKTKTDCSTVYHFTLPAGLSQQDFLDNEEAIQNYVGKDIKIEYTFKEIVIEEFNEKMRERYDFQPIKSNAKVPIIVGYDRRGQLVTCDLGAGEPHMLIAGQTGGGKSTSIRCILTNLILSSNVKLHLIDLKNGVELRTFYPCNKVATFSRNISQARSVLEQLSIEVDSRYDLFYKEGVKDIAEYNKKHHNSMDYQLLVADEFADLQGEKDCMSMLDELGRKARACGIHMILSTQRPDAKVLSGAIKANIPTVLGLKATNSTNSHIIIDEVGLDKLRGSGRGLFKRDGKITEIQAPYISPEDAEKLIKYTFVDKTQSSAYTAEMRQAVAL